MNLLQLLPALPAGAASATPGAAHALLAEGESDLFAQALAQAEAAALQGLSSSKAPSFTENQQAPLPMEALDTSAVADVTAPRSDLSSMATLDAWRGSASVDGLASDRPDTEGGDDREVLGGLAEIRERMNLIAHAGLTAENGQLEHAQQERPVTVDGGVEVQRPLIDLFATAKQAAATSAMEPTTTLASTPAAGGIVRLAGYQADAQVQSRLANDLQGNAGDGESLEIVGSPIFRVEGGSQPSSIQVGQPSGSGFSTTTLSAPINTPEWRGGLSHQLIGMHLRGDQQVDLHLNPADLGPLSVSMKIVDSEAQVHFLSAHQQVRAAVESAIPQLREALAEQGIGLGQTSVGEHRQSQTQGDRSASQNHHAAEHGAVDSEAEDAGQIVTTTLRNLSGRINTYA